MAMQSPPDDTASVPLSRLRARLAAPRGAQRVDALLSADDAGAAVAALSVPELHQLISEVGFADTQELIALATPAQLRGCLDLDAWDRDRLQPAALEPWLAALVEAGYEKLGEVWGKLDSELTALFLARSCRIYDLSLEEEPDEPDDVPVATTPDTFFALALISEREETRQLVHRVVEDLYRADQVLARHTIMAARSEPTAELEEQSYRWRAGRMADLGYADFYEALEVYRPLDPGAIRLDEDSADRFGDEADDTAHPTLPARLTEPLAAASFLARAMDTIAAPAELDRLETALVVLVNKVASAARVGPGDTEGLAVAAEHALATLSLGLETVSGGDVGRAGALLAGVSVTRLHRAGYTVTLRLARMARALAPRAFTAGEPTISLLGALVGKRAYFPSELDDPPGVGPRPFRAVEDVRVAAQHLTALALRVAIADALGVDLVALAEHPEPPALDDHVRTALVRALAGGALSPAPLSAAELRAFRTRALADGALTGEARAAAGRALIAALDRARVVAARELLPALVGRWLDELADTLGTLDPARAPDPRFVQGVILDADRA